VVENLVFLFGIFFVTGCMLLIAVWMLSGDDLSAYANQALSTLLTPDNMINTGTYSAHLSSLLLVY